MSNPNPKYQIIAGLSVVLTLLALMNIIYKVYKTQDTEHLTYTWIFLIFSAQSLLVIYGLLNNAYDIYLPASILVLGISYILFVKIRNKIEDDKY